MSSLSRQLFGPNRKEIWRQLAGETGATYVEGGFWKGDKVQASHCGWTITLEVVPMGKAQGTHLRAPYLNPERFHFTVYRHGFFTDLGKMLGMQDVEVGHADFDRDFVIKGNDESKLRRLFANPRIRQLIAAQPQIYFTVKDPSDIWNRDLFGEPPPRDVHALDFLVMGVIKDKERLRLLFELFGETLYELCRMGSAYQIADET